MRLLIGSRALQFHNLLDRDPKDYDWISYYDSFELFKKTVKVRNFIPKNNGNKIILFSTKDEEKRIDEFEIAWENSLNCELLKIVKNDVGLCTQVGDDTYIAAPNLIFSLKKSHRYLKNSPHFAKTRADYQRLKGAGCYVPDHLKEWYKKREKETYNYQHPKLNVSKSEFFKDDMVPYKYDHDSLHLAVAHLDRPAYEYYKEDLAEVNCSKEKFFSLPEIYRLYGVLEEAYVLALERSQIPAKKYIEPKKSFEIALSKVCTSITSGFFREFAYENYDKVMALYSDQYIEKFKQGLASGVVKEI